MQAKPALLKKLDKIYPRQLGKKSVVILPLKEWQAAETLLEEYQMSLSASYRRSIQESRNQIKVGRIHAFDIDSGRFKKLKG